MTTQRDVQDRWFNADLDIIGFDANIGDVSGVTAEQILNGQLWGIESGLSEFEYLNERDGLGDGVTGKTCLFVNDNNTGSDPSTSRVIAEDALNEAFVNGFEVRTNSKPEEASDTTGTSGSCAWSFDIGADQDPRATYGYLLVDTSAPNTSYGHFSVDVQSINETGYLEFTYLGLTNQTIVTRVIFGQGSGFDSYVALNTDEQLQVSIGGVVYSSPDWQLLAGEDNKVQIQRNTGTLDVTINDIPRTQITGVSNSGIQIRYIGRAAGTYSSFPFGITNMKAQKNSNSSILEWDWDSGTDVILEKTGDPEGKPINIRGYNADGWKKVGGFNHRLLLTSGVDTTANDLYGWALHDAGGKAVEGTIPRDNLFHSVVVVVGPSVNNEWGPAELFIDDVSEGQIADWVDGSTQDSTKLLLASGSTAADTRLSKHTQFQLQI